MTKQVQARSILVTLCLLVPLLSACGRDPGPLAGTWHLEGPVPLTTTFRPGEEETMGIIEKVSYKVEGRHVLVTYRDGMVKGTTMRYTVLGPDLLQSGLGTLRRAGSGRPSQADVRNQKKQMLEQNTVCAHNADSGKCSCYHRTNGLKVAKSKSECVALARSGAAE